MLKVNTRHQLKDQLETLSLRGRTFQMGNTLLERFLPSSQIFGSSGKEVRDEGKQSGNDRVKVNIHYHRFGNDYAGWNVWHWQEGKAAQAAHFEKEDNFGKVTTIEVDRYAKDVGFIIRKNHWEQRDIGYDRKISISKVDQNGEINIYLRQNEPEVRYSKNEMPRVKNMTPYLENDLGVTFKAEGVGFKVWAPTVDKAELLIYRHSNQGEPEKILDMKPGPNGTWEAQLPLDAEGLYYTYRVDGREAVDPYAPSSGANSQRGQIIDFEKTNPPGWDKDSIIANRPFIKNPTDSIIYELHVRNYTIDSTSGVDQSLKGKFLGLTQKGTRCEGLTTNIDHLKELGVTHVQLLPVFDFGRIDEINVPSDRGNWGYDPVHWNVPEGSYSSNALQGDVRVREFKEMVKAFHDNGIRVIMDVVYPHTFYPNMADPNKDSNLNRLVPGYYYRKFQNGGYANGSGCGNEVASEKEMTRKLIVDSVLRWAKEYHVDGFRFDQMSLLDVDTLNSIRNELNKIDRNILMYGEGWDRSQTLPHHQGAGRHNISRIKGIGFFNNEYSSAIRGDFNGNGETGILQGNAWKADRVRYGLAGDAHDSTTPDQMINYVACHDNLCLWDNLNRTMNASYEDKLKAHKLGYAVTLLSQGIPFITEGDEMLRTKNGNHNSWNAPDSLNKIDWKMKHWHKDVNDYVKGMIELRKAHPAFRITNSREIFDKTYFVNDSNKNVIKYTIDRNANNDPVRKFEVMINYGTNSQWMQLSEARQWSVLADGWNAGNRELRTVNGEWVEIPPKSMLVLADSDSFRKMRSMQADQLKDKLLNRSHGKEPKLENGQDKKDKLNLMNFLRQ